MEFSKFLPVVIEIVIDDDLDRTFVCRNSNGVVMKILHEISELSNYFEFLCEKLTTPPSEH